VEHVCLLDACPDTNFGMQDGDTALTLASESGHVDIVKVLLKYNAKVDAKNIVSVHALSIHPLAAKAQ
jgi:ankyrin repeat protein